MDILEGIAEGIGDSLRVGGIGEVEGDEVFTPAEENRQREREQRGDGEDFEAEGIADTLVVVRARVLRGKDARAGDAAENAEIENEEELVGDRDAAHLQRTNLTDHDVVQKADEVGDGVLDNDGNDDSGDVFVKGAIADEGLTDFLHEELLVSGY